MSIERFSEYRVMWIMVFFDLPTETKRERREHALFRKNLMRDGFTMFQFSIYIRHCASKENMQVHIKRIKKIIPEKGKVGIIGITDKQFGEMEIYIGKKESKPEANALQLELF